MKNELSRIDYIRELINDCRYDDAFEALEVAQEKEPDNWELFYEYARLQFELGDYSSAVANYEELIKLIIDNKADVVYGSRLTGAKPSRSFMFTHLLGNKLLTLTTNVLYGATLTDMETCYKAFRTSFLKGIQIKSDRFDFEPEITAKVLKRKARLYELPISYYGREYSEGKKITWKDGIHAIIALIRFRFSD